jgi:hypothetical protein
MCVSRACLHLAQFALDAVQGVLGVVQENQATRAGLENLATQLGADGPPGAGDHHHLVRDAAIDQLRVRRHGVATEEIVEVDILDLADHRGTGHEFVDLGYRAHVHRQADQGVDDLAAALRRCGGNGQQHLRNRVLLYQPLEVLRGHDLQAIDHRMLGARIVVDEGHDAVLVTVVQCGQQLAPGFTGAVDEYVLGAGAQPGLVAGAHHEARTADKHMATAQ